MTAWKCEDLITRRTQLPVVVQPVRDQVKELRKAARAGLTALDAACVTGIPLQRVLAIRDNFAVLLRADT